MQTPVSPSPAVHERAESREFLGLTVRKQLAGLRAHLETLPPQSSSATIRRVIIEAALPKVPADQAINHIFAVFDAGIAKVRAGDVVASAGWQDLFSASSATRVILEMTGMLDAIEAAGAQHQAQDDRHRFAYRDEHDGPMFETVQQAIRAAHIALAVRNSLN